MIRRWLVQPDLELETENGSIGVVSIQALANELAQLAPILHRQGGVVSIVQQRTPGFLEGEMLTTAVVFEWKDRTDAKVSPERATQVVTPELHEDGRAQGYEPREDETGFLEADDEPRAVPLDEVEADESSIPVALRS